MSDQPSRAAVTLTALSDLERQRIAFEERARQVSRDPLGERADRFSPWHGETLAMETRNVRIDMSFGDVMAIRQQAEMIKGFMDDVIAVTSEPHLGDIKQRMQARQAADAGRRQLARFNGKKPRGDTSNRKRP
jgi:hypothetical protein